MHGFLFALILCLAIPILASLAYIRWWRVTRQELPHWRNGVGLASLVIVSANWSFDVALYILPSIRPHSTSFYNPDWLALQLYSSLAAVLLAMALKGSPRLQTIAAGALMVAFVKLSVYA
jgi:hypothetical protein